MTAETWNCPTCSLARMAYGTNCPTWLTGCPNAATPNATGAWYLRQEVQKLHTLEAVTSVGIAAISDEGKGDL